VLTTLLVTLLMTSAALASTIIPGGNYANKTWTLAGSPYIVQGDVIVPAGTSLNIEAGVEVRVVNGDAQAAGLNAGKVEITVRGTLNAVGTAANPIVFHADVGTSTGTWYGIVVDVPTGVLNLDQVTVQHATYGFYISDGAPTLKGVTASVNSWGFYFTNKGGGSIVSSIARSNTQDGVGCFLSTGSATVNVTNTTIDANSTSGVQASGSGGFVATVNVKNAIITNNGNYGVRSNSGSNVTVTYSDVWNNSFGNYLGTSGGTGTLSANPLYVGSGNMRLTSNSPARFASDIGTDIGPLPYVSDPTPALEGVLWTNTTLTAAGSPYTVPGDLTVAPAVTLTIDPGVTLQIVNGDGMGSGLNAGKVEITIRGTLKALGTTANPITLKAQVGTSTGTWYGIVVDTPQAQIQSSQLAVQHATYGFYVSDGAPTLNGIIASVNSWGFYFTNKGGGSIVNAIAKSNTQDGVGCFLSTGSATVNITNSTIHANSTSGVQASGSGGFVATVNVKNAIITSNGNYGVRSNSGSSATVTYSDVWNNSFGNYLGTSAGTGCISQNPNYESAPTSLKLLGTSVCIDSGTGTGAPTNDIDGAVRPLDGDGFGGAGFDMGAYEFVPAAFCGDGVVGPGEVCDSGAQNGQYGFCKADCSGLGPRCGDGIVNGPEQCDDGNTSNNDMCTTACQNAKCGDGFVQPGEQCDDGNTSNNDACTNTCQSAKCGDGFVQPGEQCDDGNTSNNDACTNTCQSAKCGDGFVQPGEECDDGNAVNTDGCTNACTLPKCGDGITQAGEECDDGNMVNTDGCTNLCKLAKCGDGIVQAGEECDDGNTVNNDACTNACKLAKCGDGIVQTGEECDDGNTVNNDGCTNLCKLPKCGDGIVQAGEECDDGNVVNGDGCTNLCKLPKCGDGIVQAGEECDDGNAVNTDACLATCKKASCGDGFVQAGVEACDDGNTIDNDACSNTCKKPGCGDGILQAGEECDDGNLDNTDGCLNTCLLAKCGDGFVHAGVEACDDGNTSNTDGCLNDCTVAKCGDGFVQDGVEECDDGNTSNTDACTNACKLAKCGDGFTQPGEECDDGNQDNTDGCNNLCKLPACGDGVVQPGEACDDGNLSNNDACLNTCKNAGCGDGFTQAGVEECDDGNGDNTDDCLVSCKIAKCGDGFVRAGVEECDDGNNVNGDGCSAQCKIEVTGTGGGGMGGAGGSGTGGGATTGPSGTGGGGGDTGEKGGCGCRTAGDDSSSNVGALLFSIALAVAARRGARRRAR
jgi:MYXO-CTERM domain-containing protein